MIRAHSIWLGCVLSAFALACGGGGTSDSGTGSSAGGSDATSTASTSSAPSGGTTASASTSGESSSQTGSSGSGLGGAGGSGTGGAGGSGGAGGMAPVSHDASAQVSAGHVMSSSGFTVHFTMGQPTQNQTANSSQSYRLRGGLVGATESLP